MVKLSSFSCHVKSVVVQIYKKFEYMKTNISCEKQIITKLKFNFYYSKIECSFYISATFRLDS